MTKPIRMRKRGERTGLLCALSLRLLVVPVECLWELHPQGHPCELFRRETYGRTS